MKIKSLELKNFRRFQDFTIGFHRSLQVIVARNGAGKSSVLDGVAVLLGSFLTRLPGVRGIAFKEADFHVDASGNKPPYMRLACETMRGVWWDRTEKRDKTLKTAKLIPSARGLKQLHEYVDQFIDAENEGQTYELPVFAYYGTGRGVFDIPQRKPGFKKTLARFDAFDGTLEGRANFKRFIEYFYFLEDAEAKAQKGQRSFGVQWPEL